MRRFSTLVFYGIGFSVAIGTFLQFSKVFEELLRDINAGVEEVTPPQLLPNGIINASAEVLVETPKGDVAKDEIFEESLGDSIDDAIKGGTQPQLLSKSTRDVNLSVEEETPKDMLANDISQEEIAQLGGMFFETWPRSVRKACAEVDKLGPPLGRHKRSESESLQVFKECMQRLEAAQEKIRFKLPNHKPCNQPQVLIHSFWDGTLQETTKLGLISSVYAHGPGCAKLTVHTSGKTTDMEQSLKTYLGSHVAVSKLNVTHLMDLIVQQFPDLKAAAVEKVSFVVSLDKNPSGLKKAKYSDLVRVLVLAAYGGVYLDSDVLVLNSLAPLLHYGKDFWYQWSTQRYGNSAVMSFTKGSPAAHKLVTRILDLGNPKRAAQSTHPRKIAPFVGNLLEMLPSAYFDANWVMSPFDLNLRQTQQFSAERYGVPSIGPPFFQAKEKAKARDEFFPGSFAYHWHNNYGDAFGNNSIADTFWRHYEHLRETGDYTK